MSTPKLIDYGKCDACETPFGEYSDGYCCECEGHPDVEDNYCLACMKDQTENMMARAFDRYKDYMKYGE